MYFTELYMRALRVGNWLWWGCCVRHPRPGVWKMESIPLGLVILGIFYLALVLPSVLLLVITSPFVLVTIIAGLEQIRSLIRYCRRQRSSLAKLQESAAGPDIVALAKRGIETTRTRPVRRVVKRVAISPDRSTKENSGRAP